LTPSAPVTTAAAAATAIPVASGAAGVLNRHPRAVQVAPVKVTHRVISIAVVIKLDKTVSLFQQNVEPSFVPFKEVLNVAYFCLGRETPNVNSAASGWCHYESVRISLCFSVLNSLGD